MDKLQDEEEDEAVQESVIPRPAVVIQQLDSIRSYLETQDDTGKEDIRAILRLKLLVAHKAQDQLIQCTSDGWI